MNATLSGASPSSSHGSNSTYISNSTSSSIFNSSNSPSTVPIATTGTAYLDAYPDRLWHHGAALYSFIGMLVCVVAALTLCLGMYFCYFPGGRRRSDVIDIGQLPQYSLSGKVPADEEDDVEDGQSDYGTHSEADNSSYYDSGSRDQVSSVIPAQVSCQREASQ